MANSTLSVVSNEEVALVISQYLLKRFILPINGNACTVTSSSPLWSSVLQSLESDRLTYCQQLASAVVQVSSRTTEGKVLDCLLEVFLASFPNHTDLRGGEGLGQCQSQC